MIARLIPHPLLSITLTLVWIGLVNKVTLGNLLLGGAFGILVPILHGLLGAWLGGLVGLSLPAAVEFSFLLGVVTLGGDGSYTAKLKVHADGETFTCAKRVGGRV